MENSREADISTKQSCAQAPPWFPVPYENGRRTPSFGASACTRA